MPTLIFECFQKNYGANILSKINSSAQAYLTFSVGDVSVSLRTFGSKPNAAMQVANGLGFGIEIR